MRYDQEFWQALDKLISKADVVIDRPKGTLHPKYPAIQYEVDYGYLNNTSSVDGGGIDIWCGTDPAGQLDAVMCTVDLMKRDSEIKLLIGCTEEEKKKIYDFHNSHESMRGVLIRRVFGTADYKIDLQPVTANMSDQVKSFITGHWGSTEMLIRGQLVDITKADGFIQHDADGKIIGLITYIVSDGVCEITSFDSVLPRNGIGTALLERVILAAKDEGCSRVQLVTTNDNINAIRFYQKRGFDLLKVNHGAVDRGRLLKPEIPLIGYNGIPLRHEIELVKKLN